MACARPAWRWRATTEEIYDQFWMQTIRHLTEARLAGGRRSVLQSDRKAYDFGDTVRISAMLQDESFQPLEAEVQAEATGDARPGRRVGVVWHAPTRLAGAHPPNGPWACAPRAQT